MQSRLLVGGWRVATSESSRIAKDVSELIGQIYDCAIDPGRWPAMLARLCDEQRFANAMLTVWTVPTGTTILNVTSGIEPTFKESLRDFGQDIVDQWGGPERINAYPVGEPIVLSRVRPRAEWIDSRYQREWVAPQGLSDFMAVAISRDAGVYCLIGVARHERAGPIGDEDIDLVRLLAPHLQRAVTISRLLDIKTIAAASFAATLDTLSSRVILVGREGRIVTANNTAKAMLADQDPVACKNDRLVLRGEAAHAALHAALSLAADNEADLGRRGIGIPASWRDGRPCVLHLLPLNRGVYRAGLVPEAVAAVFIAPALGPPPLPADAVAALFDLTPAETRVFCSIVGGNSLSETARHLGVSEGTAKTHLLRLFNKTNTHRQTELVRLAHSLSATV